MIVLEGSHELCYDRPSAVTIGKFDGIHRGHQALIRDLVEVAKEKGLSPLVFTFSTESFFSQKKLITTKEERREILASLGVECLVEFPFDEETRNTSAEDFIERILCRNLKAKHLTVGEDFRFGKDRKGDTALLQEKVGTLIESLHIIPSVRGEEGEVRSTRIREELAKGDMEAVHSLLGVNYQIHGTVIHGKALGRTIGFPTINIRPKKEKLLPPLGVYFVHVWLRGECHAGVANLGTSPTVREAGEEALLEVYLLDFEGDVYGEEARVIFDHFSRPEVKLSGIEELRKLIQKDEAEARSYYATYGQRN